MSMPLTVPPSWTLADRRRGSRVVLGYDRTRAARAALAEAARRVSPDGTLVVVYASRSPDALVDAAGYEDVVGAHDRCVQQIRQDVAETDLGDATVEVRLARNPVAEALVGTGQALEADEIIIGHRRRSRIGALIGHRVSRSVLRLSDRPVVMVPEPIDRDDDEVRR